MSRWIRLSNRNGRDSKARMMPRQNRHTLQYQAFDGRTVNSCKVIKTPLPKTYEHLSKQIPDNKEFVSLLMESDPEIDLEAAGRKVGSTDRIFLDSDGNVLYSTSKVEIIYDSNGYQVEQKIPSDIPANINSDIPLMWTKKYYKRSEAISRFIFTRNYQIVHVDGLIFDFLFAMAEELHNADSLVLIGAGNTGKEPIIMERNGLPYRGFLEGRINDDKYLLVLHLSSLELTQPEWCES